MKRNQISQKYRYRELVKQRAMIQWSTGYDDPDPSICEVDVPRGVVGHQKRASMKREEEEE